MHHLVVAAIAAALVAGHAPARADDADAGAAPEEPDAGRRAGAIAAALVPGALVHGAGHWVLRERRTAKRLLVAEAIALGLVIAGGVPIAATGGADESMPGLVLVVPGVGLLVTSWFADLYGAAGGARLGGVPQRAPPVVEVAAGALAVADPVFDATVHATAAARGWLGRARLEADVRAGDGAWRIRGGGAVRLLGGTPGAPARDGRALDVRAAVSDERVGEDDLGITIVELAVAGRWDLVTVGDTLAGAYVTGELGVGAERVRYDATDAADTSALPVLRFGFGVDLGDGGGRHATVEAWYEHRRDDLAGGLLLPIGSNGFVGRVGVSGEAWRGAWGLVGGVEAGSAWVFGLAVARRFGGAP